MGLTGKILGILCVVAALGFVILAATDYAKQREWTAVAFQQDILLNGLPLNASERDVHNEVIANKLTARMLQNLFSGAGAPVRTQEDEIKAKRNWVTEQVNQAGNNAKQKLAEILIPVARSYPEREVLWRQIQTQSVEELLGEQGPVKAAFEIAEDTSKSPDQRKQAIAHLLVNLGGQAPDAQQRAATVCGLKAYEQAASSQAMAYRDMLPAIQVAMQNDLKEFVIQQKELVGQILSQADRLQVQREDLQKNELIRDQHRALVERRKEDIAELQQMIVAAEKAAAQAQATQKELELALEAANQAVTRTNEQNQALENQIRSFEASR